MDPDLDIFGPYGWDTDAGEDFGAAVGIDPLVLDAHLGAEMLLIGQPWAVGSGADSEEEFVAPFGDLDDWGWSTARETIYIAATHSRSTANDDEPAAEYVAGRLMPFNFGSAIFSGVDPLDRGGANSGLIRLVDPDGVLNAKLLGRNWDSAPLILKRGRRGARYTTFSTVGSYRSAGLLRDLSEKQLRLRDLGWRLEGALHGETYGGTGGLDGDVRLAGTLKPWALGYCFNVGPILLNEADQIFQWSLSSSLACTAVRHGGSPITIDNDYTDRAALAAATIPSGGCATCLAESLVRLNLTLQFGVRVDVTGDADTVNGHGAPLTRASIIRRILTHRGDSRLDEAEEIDASSLQRMEAYHSAPVGWWFGGDTAKRAALERCLDGVLGWYRVRPDGRLSVGWLSAPEQMSPAVTFDFRSHGMGMPRLVATTPPRRGTRIGYRFNHAPQERGDLTGSVSDENAEIYKAESRFSQAMRPAIGTLYPTSQIVTTADSGFRDEVDSALEAERQQSIFDVERNGWAIDLQVDPHIDLIGSGAGLRGRSDVVGEDSVMICVGIDAAGSSVSTFEFFV